MSFDFSTLVTDRTQADVNRVKQIAEKIKNGTASESELAEFNNAAMKGAYNHTDLNRVNAAMEALNSEMLNRGYSSGYKITTKVWTEADAPVFSDMKRYLDNVSALRSAVAVFSYTPTVPQNMENLSVSKANAIEKILLDIEAVLMLITESYRYSGQFSFYSGVTPLPAGNIFGGRTWAEVDALHLTWADWDQTTFWRLLYEKEI